MLLGLVTGTVVVRSALLFDSIVGKAGAVLLDHLRVHAELARVVQAIGVAHIDVRDDWIALAVHTVARRARTGKQMRWRALAAEAVDIEKRSCPFPQRSIVDLDWGTLGR